MAKKKDIKAEASVNPDTESKFTILGTYEGECADANITNNNGLDITQEVWEHVFNSDDYKQGIDKGWFIGYLGHPEDPGCMEFKNACIVMTEGHIDPDGKVYGKFNLVDTPVGRIVKTFQDAGVTFGISVRGAGDIVSNSVDPESFVFRGFDLVSFPAYPESIPTFTAIAASTNTEEKQKFEKICASVKVELPSIDTPETIDEIQAQFPEQSEVYDELETRKNELSTDVIEPTIEDRVNLLEAQVEGLLNLYADAVQECEESQCIIDDLNENYNSEQILMSRKMHVMARIVAAQENDVKELADIYSTESAQLENKNKIMASANAKLKDEVYSAQKALDEERSHNLNYIKKIESSSEDLDSKDKVISSLQDKLDKTVIEASDASAHALNLEAENDELRQAIKASEELVEGYQDAYATLYSKALGVDLSKGIAVNASMSVGDLRSRITAASSINNISQGFDVPEDVDFDVDDENDLVTC